MPSLKVTAPDWQRPRVVSLFKRITTIGSSPDCDVVIGSGGLGPVHANIHFDGNRFTVNAVERRYVVEVNGRKVQAHRLSHGDEIRLGPAVCVFRLYDEPADDEQRRMHEVRLDGLRKMVEFSRRLMERVSVEELLNDLLDAVIELTRADKGMLILLEGGRLRVKAARNLKKETISDAVEKVSDTILAQVVKTKKPLIVSDALNHEVFRSSESVVNLKLCSVMAVPLLERGEIFGVLYLGNDNVVNLFEQDSLELLEVFAAQASLIVRNALLLDELRYDNRQLNERLEQMKFGEIIGSCDAMRDIFRKIEKVAPTDISVLITGETGTGKELVARRIHQLSGRRNGPFVTINCGAIPPNLLESELFGHVRGAFTGATHTRAGKFQAADGGTLFLDEIGELSPELQVKLLRVLQDKQVVKVGDTRPEPVDIRIVAATNRDLEKDLESGRFREDLYYRLNVITLHLPPLRQRGDDIFLIARYLLQKFNEELGGKAKGFSPAALEAMKKYSWPGNIRELENRLRKAVVLSEATHLGPADLGLEPADLEPIMPLARAKEEFQRRYVMMALERNRGNRTKTARELGVDPRTIFRYLEKMEGRKEEGR